MKSWTDLSHFAGFDWASEHHDVVVVDRSGNVVADFRFEDTAEGWQEFAKQTGAFPALGVTIETCRGSAVERLLQTNATVFPVNPKNAERYRERKVSAGVKTDRLDAWSLADALRLDGHTWMPLKPEDPHLQELRTLCRDEVKLIEQRTALVNQFQHALREYYPTVLEAFEDMTRPSSWAFVEAFPTPQALVDAGKRRWEKFLHVHKLYRPETWQKRLECFSRATQFCGGPAVTAAKSRLAVALAKMLRTLEGQLAAYRARIEELFEQHPDHGLFGSLPGIGAKIAPRLLGEIGDDRARFDDAESLQCYAGTAPVSVISGKHRNVHMRRACNMHLRHAVHFLANLSRMKCPWAQTYYEKKREDGDSHASALRALGQRWLRILWRMWQDRKTYDPELHQRNQLKHGSWVMKFVPTGQG